MSCYWNDAIKGKNLKKEEGVKKYILLITLILIFIVGVVWVMTSEEGKTFKIRRRTYSNFGQVGEDNSFMIKNRKKISMITR